MQIVTQLRNRAVALLWGGLSLSAIGDQLYTVALSWISVAVFGAAAGYLNALGCFCLLITALFVGGWADRWDQMRAMVCADLTRAGILVIVVAAWMTTGQPSAIGLALAVAVLGAGQAVFRPAMQSVMPALVSRDALPALNALFDSTDRIARMLGPGLVGLLAAVIPTRHFLSLDALTFLASASAITAIRRVQPVPIVRRRRMGGHVLTGIIRGFRAVSRHALLRFLQRNTPVINGGWYASLFLGVPLAIERHHITGPGGTGLAAYGLVISSYGCTNLIATLVVGNRTMPVRPQRQIFIGNLVLGGGLLLLGLVPSIGLPQPWLLPAMCAAAAFAAPGGPMQDIPVAVMRQTELPRAAVPAVMRAYLVVSNIGMLTAMIAAPTVFSLSLPFGMACCGGAIMAVGVVGLLRFASGSPPASRHSLQSRRR